VLLEQVRYQTKRGEKPTKHDNCYIEAGGREQEGPKSATHPGRCGSYCHGEKQADERIRKMTVVKTLAWRGSEL
jgi:hypothetical protein